MQHVSRSRLRDATYMGIRVCVRARMYIYSLMHVSRRVCGSFERDSLPAKGIDDEWKEVTRRVGLGEA